MKKLDKNQEISENRYELSELSKKKDVNLRSNSSLYFQIGLILCLLASYGLLEMEFEKSDYNFVMKQEPTEETNFVFVTEDVKPKVVVKKQVKQKKNSVLSDKPLVVTPDDSDIEPTDIATPDEIIPDVIDRPTKVVDKPKVIPNTGPMDLNKVEIVPVFPGCESAGTNAERLACMSDKITKLIQKKFNTDLAAQLGLSGVQKIQVQFKIDPSGKVTDIKTRSPYSELEKEAERVVNKIPLMTPGKQLNTPVAVIYNLPIVFDVQ